MHINPSHARAATYSPSSYAPVLAVTVVTIRVHSVSASPSTTSSLSSPRAATSNISIIAAGGFLESSDDGVYVTVIGLACPARRYVSSHGYTEIPPHAHFPVVPIFGGDTDTGRFPALNTATVTACVPSAASVLNATSVTAPCADPNVCVLYVTILVFSFGGSAPSPLRTTQVRTLRSFRAHMCAACAPARVG